MTKPKVKRRKRYPYRVNGGKEINETTDSSNIFCQGQKVLSPQGKKNFDRIRWDNDIYSR